jgi:rfaE bifunctional protein kinase chain/domain/rfaE bifunctional protein nucleotidyltransferase chain/domain
MKKIYKKINTRSKIFNRLNLLNKIKDLKKKKVLCHGVFDLIHAGHLRYFKQAKELGDFLIVSLTSDRYVNKGINRPIFNQNLRAEMLESLEIIDAVYINDAPTSVNVIKLVRPDIYLKGPDYKNLKQDRTKNILKEISTVKKYGGTFKTTDNITFSSSNLINNNFSYLNSDQINFVRSIRKKYSFDYILKKINELKKLKVLLISETIIDQYIFGDVMGKAGKEPHLVMSEQLTKNFLGGGAAIANHLSTFCEKIDFVSMLGEKKKFYSFVKKNLSKNIVPFFLYKKNSPTILKKRFIDNVSKKKLLGVYSINEDNFPKKDILMITKLLKKISKFVDLVIISDYGHGLISQPILKIINSCNKHISLNAQINSYNFGYHSLTKYNKVNMLVINENELRHELRDKNSALEKLAYDFIKKFKTESAIITRGSSGSIFVRKNKKIISCPAFARDIVDKIGAGDATLSVVSLCNKKKFPDDLTLYLGALAGGFSVETIANSRFLDKDKLLRQLEYQIK